jgi:hypothetical protein
MFLWLQCVSLALESSFRGIVHVGGPHPTTRYHIAKARILCSFVHLRRFLQL